MYTSPSISAGGAAAISNISSIFPDDEVGVGVQNGRSGNVGERGLGSSEILLSPCGLGNSETPPLPSCGLVGSSSLRPLVLVSDWEIVAASRSARALARRLRSRRAAAASARARPEKDPIAMPVMVPEASLVDLAARGNLNVKSWFVITLTEAPAMLVLLGVMKATGALVTHGVEPANAEV